MNSRPPIRSLLATALTLGLLLSNQLPFAISRSATVELNLKSESQIRSEAAVYDTAIREIGGISSMKLANPDESKAAIAVLKKQIPNLRFNRSKLIALGLSDSNFRSAVRSRTNDKKSSEEFAAELARDRTAILKLNGAQSLKDGMLRAVQSDGSMLRKIADQLKQAAADIRAKTKSHHAVLTNPVLTTKSSDVEINTSASSTSLKGNEGAAITALVVCAFIVSPPLGVALVLLSVNSTLLTIPVAVAENIAVYAAEMLLVLHAAGGTDQQKDEIQACVDRAQAACDKCVAEAAALVVPFTEPITVPLSIAAADLCLAQQILELLLCY